MKRLFLAGVVVAMLAGCGGGGGGSSSDQQAPAPVAKVSVVDGTWNHYTSPFLNARGTQLELLAGMGLFDDVMFSDGKVSTSVPAIVPIGTLPPPPFSADGGPYSAKYGTFSISGNTITITFDSMLLVANGNRILTEGLKPWAITPVTATCNFTINGNIMTLTDSAGNTADFKL